MKIKNISLNNFAKYDSVSVSFDENVTYLVGKNGSGKSTIGLTAIWFLFQGVAEKASGGNNPLIGERFRFIGPKGPTAKGEMILVDEKTKAEIKVMRKLTKSGTEVSFEGPEGMELGQKWLTDLFNVFLIAPKMFCDLSPKEQAKVLGIDTKTFDEAIVKLKQEYTAHNAVYRSYGELTEVAKVEKVDIEVLRTKKEKIRQDMAVIYRQNQAANKLTRDTCEGRKILISEDTKRFNDAIQKSATARIALKQHHDLIVETCKLLGDQAKLVNYTKLTAFIAQLEPLDNPKDEKLLWPPEPTNLAEQPEDYVVKENELVYIREIPDDKELKAIDLEIYNAAETNQKAMLYEQYLEKTKLKEAKKKDLDTNQTAQKAKEDERVAYIKKFKFPFSNLTVGEDGELLLQGKPIKEPYFSTGEILKVVPILLSTSNPDLKYVFLQDFNLMDEEKQKEISDYLTGKGFQLVVEMVGKAKIVGKNSILLRDNVVVEDYDETKAPELE